MNVVGVANELKVQLRVGQQVESVSADVGGEQFFQFLLILQLVTHTQVSVDDFLDSSFEKLFVILGLYLIQTEVVFEVEDFIEKAQLSAVLHCLLNVLVVKQLHIISGLNFLKKFHYFLDKGFLP